MTNTPPVAASTLDSTHSSNSVPIVVRGDAVHSAHITGPSACWYDADVLTYFFDTGRRFRSDANRLSFLGRFDRPGKRPTA
jgi:hypothetical protein